LDEVVRPFKAESRRPPEKKVQGEKRGERRKVVYEQKGSS